MVDADPKADPGGAAGPLRAAKAPSRPAEGVGPRRPKAR